MPNFDATFGGSARVVTAVPNGGPVDDAATLTSRGIPTSASTRTRHVGYGIAQLGLPVLLAAAAHARPSWGLARTLAAPPATRCVAMAWLTCALTQLPTSMLWPRLLRVGHRRRARHANQVAVASAAGAANATPGKMTEQTTAPAAAARTHRRREQTEKKRRDARKRRVVLRVAWAQHCSFKRPRAQRDCPWHMHVESCADEYNMVLWRSTRPHACNRSTATPVGCAASV